MQIISHGINIINEIVMMLSTIYQMLDKIVLHGEIILYISALYISATVMTYPFKEFLLILLIIIIIKSSSWFHPWSAQNEWCLECKVQQTQSMEWKNDCLLQSFWANNRLHCYLQYHKLFKNHYWGHCGHHQHLVSLHNRTAPRKGPQKNVSNMTRLSLVYYVAIFT